MKAILIHIPRALVPQLQQAAKDDDRPVKLFIQNLVKNEIKRRFKS